MLRSFLFVFILLFLFSCSGYEKISFRGEAQGTYYAITYYDRQERDLQVEIDSILKEFDQTASVWEKNSVISRVNRNDTDVILNRDFIEIFNKSMEVSEMTDGAFDITVGPLIRSWGFWFENDKRDVNQKLIDSIMPAIGYKKVKLENGRIVRKYPGIYFDFNAIAQGYSVDLLAEFLESKGIEKYLIDIGGLGLMGMKI
jgi:thiamine biosynthesis lipoprotein